ncbi:hypothetical protein V5799_023092 [Amblyomma americanum]|uniref:Uncharacterized protein n=1 Tax=Amblyomma americanum TaxID=6943 RepID=A0AAQ4FKP8_AMBAM
MVPGQPAGGPAQQHAHSAACPKCPCGAKLRSTPTVPDEDFSLILRVEAGHIEDQRTSFRPPDAAPTTSSAPIRASLKGSLKSALRGSRHSKSKQ